MALALDEVFVKINGEPHYLRHAVDHEGEVLEVLATKRRDRRAALKVLKRPLKHYGQPGSIVTDRLCSYGAAMKAIGIVGRQDVGVGSISGRKLTSAVPTKRGAMAKFRNIRTFQKFAAVHASVQNHFHQDRHLNRRTIFTQKRAVALAEWRHLAA
jgi:putative transposase